MKDTIKYIKYLQDVGIRLTLKNGRLKSIAPKGVLTDNIRSQISERKDEIIKFLSEIYFLSDEKETFIHPVSRAEPLYLSFAQQRLWFLDKLEQGKSAAYNIPMNIRVQGNLDILILKETLNEIVKRHEVLRTVFKEPQKEDGKFTEPVQLILPELFIEIPLTDISSINEKEREKKAKNIVSKEAAKPFDLSNGPLIKAGIIKLGENDHILSINVHHIAFDGWSTGIFLKEFKILYKAFSDGQPSPLSQTDIQYADFAKWQKEQLTGEKFEAHLNYWKEKLENAPLLLELPLDYSRPPVQTFKGDYIRFEIDSKLTHSLKDLTQKTGATLFMTLYSAFAVLLSKYSGKEDIVIGSPIANRNHKQIEPLIGFFVNILALRADLSNDPDFISFMEQVKNTTLEAYEHQNLPVEKLIDELNIKRNMSHNPLVQAAFAMQNAPMENFDLPGIQFSLFEFEYNTSKTDLMLNMEETFGKIKGGFEYNTDLFNSATIKQMIGHFQNLLREIADNPDKQISEFLASYEIPLAVKKNHITKKDPYADIRELSNLTDNQFLVWITQEMYPDVPLYNLAATHTFSDKINPAHFRKAFQTLVNSSDAMRTVIKKTDGVPQQSVLEQFPYAVEYLDFSEKQDDYISAWIHEKVQKQIDLKSCLFDSVLIKALTSKYIWFINIHHIVADGIAHSIIFTLMSKIYRRLAQGDLQEKTDIPQFNDYLIYEKEYKKSDHFQTTQNYWKDKLGINKEPLQFYGSYSEKLLTRVERVSYKLDISRIQKLKNIAQQKEFFVKSPDVSLYNILGAILSIYLYKISSSQSFFLGIPHHNRKDKQFADTIGLMMTVRPLQILIEDDDTFVSLARKIGKEAVETLKYSRTSIGNPGGNTYDVFFNYISASFSDFNEKPAEMKWIYTGFEQNTLALQISDFARTGEFKLDFDFSCDVFKKEQQKTGNKTFSSGVGCISRRQHTGDKECQFTDRT